MARGPCSVTQGPAGIVTRLRAADRHLAVATGCGLGLLTPTGRP
ncbi:hypothetical protein [Kitasatospora purpeofusca]|uniref:Uncharacterized protein n=1 Tax=Kitasatospora purpeofusca TaxID=67352 RepID=A0ABZ1U526_9ACTN|nr:hypothetical protein [Kitasatospora purpeofusca]